MNKEMRKNFFTSQRGITLIALVVTIIVLLILTAVTITLITGDESVILQAKASKQKQQESSDIEAIKVAVSAQNMKLAIAGGTKTKEYFDAIVEELEDRYNDATAEPDPDNAENLKIVVMDAEDPDGREYRVLEDGTVIVWEDENATTSPTSAPTQTSTPTPTPTPTTPTPTPTTQVTLALTGAGTQSSPYLIYDADDLTYLAQIVNAGDSCTGEYFVLMNDINLAGVTITTIGDPNSGNNSVVFNGIFNGQGNALVNLNTFANTITYVALFGYTGENAVIRNLNIENVSSSEVLSLRGCRYSSL